MANELTSLNEAKAKIEKEMADIAAKPNDMISKWLTQTNKTIAKLPNRAPKKKGNLTMRQFLEQIRDRLRDEPSKMAQEAQAYYEKRLSAVNAEISSISGGSL